MPGYLMSQSNHLIVGRIDGTRNIQTIREMHPRYAPGWPKETDETCPHRFGFWTRYKEGFAADGRWYYWPHIRAWHDRYCPASTCRHQAA